MAVDATAAQEFLRTNHRAVLATFRRDGRPALSPVTAGIDEQGRVVVSTRETAMKVQHLRRDPRVALTAFTDNFYGDWVQVEGTAEIVDLPEAMDLLIAYYRSVSGEHPDWDDYRAAMERDQRVIVRFAIERAGPNVSG
ncbi:MAG TPA: PPOX class F420-dependent oxidoreductase [Jatrophihabitans sp.]|nr:PPOX class F420-dependent oxidoreductase [Jatrophihabitans sp.]